MSRWKGPSASNSQQQDQRPEERAQTGPVIRSMPSADHNKQAQCRREKHGSQDGGADDLQGITSGINGPGHVG